MNAQLLEAIDSLLPQTQCTRCGFPTCRAYAEALARGESDINRCPPAGQAGVQRLARLLGREEKSLDPACGAEKPRTAALIDEVRCIGCTLCIRACPVDAIVGAANRMHTVLTAYCTGCELCVPPCPVDCIDMIGLDGLAARGHAAAVALAGQSLDEMAAIARTRYADRQDREARDRRERLARLSAKGAPNVAAPMRTAASPDTERKRSVIRAALERARARRAQSGRNS